MFVWQIDCMAIKTIHSLFE